MRIRLSGFMGIEEENSQSKYLTSPKAQAAFARLTLERDHGTKREHLAEVVWPEKLPQSWSSALRSIVSRIRSYLNSRAPQDFSLLFDGSKYVLQLPETAEIDIEAAESSLSFSHECLARGAHQDAFHTAERVAHDLRGSFLSLHEGEWVADVRERVDALRLSALEVASLASASLGKPHQALSHANEVIRHSPFRESSHRCRIMAHVVAGNRAEALHAYHELRQLLADELGVSPAPELQSLYMNLLQDSPQDAFAHFGTHELLKRIS